MALFENEVRKQLTEILNEMKDDVKLVYFTQQIECPMCREASMFVNEISSLSEKLSQKTYNFVTDKTVAEEYGVDKIPAIVILDKDGTDLGIKYYGVPGGYEINSFLGTVLEVSGHGEEIPDEILNEIKSVKNKIDIKVFVSLACPHCPGAVSTSHRLALENENIRAEMIDSNTFPYLAQRYNVTGVPKIIINEKYELTGAHPINSFLEIMKKIEQEQ